MKEEKGGALYSEVKGGCGSYSIYCHHHSKGGRGSILKSLKKKKKKHPLELVLNVKVMVHGKQIAHRASLSGSVCYDTYQCHPWLTTESLQPHSNTFEKILT